VRSRAGKLPGWADFPNGQSELAESAKVAWEATRIAMIAIEAFIAAQLIAPGLTFLPFFVTIIVLLAPARKLHNLLL
jgi:hypothetical protein